MGISFNVRGHRIHNTFLAVHLIIALYLHVPAPIYYTRKKRIKIYSYKSVNQAEIIINMGMCSITARCFVTLYEDNL